MTVNLIVCLIVSLIVSLTVSLTVSLIVSLVVSLSRVCPGSNAMVVAWPHVTGDAGIYISGYPMTPWAYLSQHPGTPAT